MGRTTFLLSIVAIFVVISLVYFGLFTKVDVEIKEAGGQAVVYEEIKGDYRQSKNVMDEIYYELKRAYMIEAKVGYGKFFDNPKITSTEELRSEAGSVIEKGDWGEIDKLEKEFSIKKIERKNYIVTEFPYKGQISVLFALRKVYPVLEEFCEEEGYQKNTPVIELYDIPNGRIIYLKELHKRH